MPHVRIRGGGDQRWSFLLRLYVQDGDLRKSAYRAMVSVTKGRFIAP